MNSGMKRGLSVVVVGLLLAGVAWKRVGLPAVPRVTVGDRPECPHDTVTWTDSGGVTHVYDKIPLSGEISGIPEYHDCQRFIQRDGKTYDSLYAIYAAFHLESLPCGLSRCGVGQAGAVGTPAATVLSYGGRYPALGIENGFNCLYLWDPPDWKAAMIPQRDNPDCRYKRIVEPLPAGAVPLTVHPIQPASIPPFRDREYPPVARWDWDSLSRQQYIGIRCGLAWCEVGAPSTAPTDAECAYPPPLPFDPVVGLSAGTGMAKAVTMVKGWFDAQRLAVSAEPSSGTLKVRPSWVCGFIVPNPVLGDLQQSHFEATWVHVAWALVGADYRSTVHLAKGRNKISLCYGTATRCRVPTGKVGCSEATPNTMWWAKIMAPDGSETYRCVVWRGYPTGIDVPGTVRWRWQADDETNWIKCPSGCCELR